MRLAILLSMAAFAVTGSFGDDLEPKHAYHSPEPFTRGLTGLLKSWAERYPMVKSLINARATALPAGLQLQVTDEDFALFSQTPVTQAFEGVEASDFNSIVEFLAESLEIHDDKRKAFLKSLEFIKNADNSDWSLLDIIFDQNDGMNCKYVSILGHKNPEQGTFDFMIADFQSSFQLASDILLIEERKSHLWGVIQTGEIREQRIPGDLKLQDIELFKTFLSQSALARFAKMLHVRVPGVDNEAFSLGAGLNAVIDAGISIVPKIINVFKTTSTSSVIREIAGEGFSHFVQSAITFVTENMKEIGVYKMIARLDYLIRIQGEALEGAKIALELGTYADRGTWNDFKIAFNDKAEENTVNFVDVICKSIADERYDIILVNVAQTFRLAPNIKYIENTKSYVGGIYSETKIERQEIPRSLTENDVKVLMGFFHITVFKRLAETYGINMPPLPERPEMKV